ncbi:MAG: hypothetical protein MRECE_9c005 [Mycoplasmataceae bacterium CE_OT135]|nr:MAG: hypothetical protein MRECE_9c005 [Mycoplasmataceae bacterium CE_OT135]
MRDKEINRLIRERQEENFIAFAKKILLKRKEKPHD